MHMPEQESFSCRNFQNLTYLAKSFRSHCCYQLMCSLSDSQIIHFACNQNASGIHRWHVSVTPVPSLLVQSHGPDITSFYAVTEEMRSLPWKEPHSELDSVFPAAVSLMFCLSECQVASPSGLPATVLCGLVLVVQLGMTRWHIYFLLNLPILPNSWL